MAKYPHIDPPLNFLDYRPHSLGVVLVGSYRTVGIDDVSLVFRKERNHSEVVVYAK